MRTALLILALLICAGGGGAAVFAAQVDSALTSARTQPPKICLSRRQKEKIAASALSLREKDAVMTNQLNREMGSMPNTWWHLRGAAIAAVYIALWPQPARHRFFDELTLKMKDCLAQVTK